MSNQSCSACNDLREYAPEFVVNGTTENVGEHLKYDEGLSGANNHTDCEDLMDVNDCLIGNMIDELEGYEVCDWKDYMATMLGNLYETLKAMIYSQCGQWCAINSLFSGQTFSVGEATEGNAYAVAGKGVSFLIPHADSSHTGDLTIIHVAGGLGKVDGSYVFYNSNFTDAGTCFNFDNGSTQRSSQSRLGNSVWGNTATSGGFPGGGELICEFRLKKSAFPQIKQFFPGFGMETGGGHYDVSVYPFDSGRWAWGQHGWCNYSDGQPSAAGYDAGHLVPNGWWYLQLRMNNAVAFSMTGDGRQYSPQAFVGIRMNPDEVSC